MDTILKNKLCKPDLFYNITRWVWTTPNHTNYYRHLNVLHKENIPTNGPLIFAPNHQNALMDAMAIVSTQKHQVVFVARADIFKKPVIIKILNFFRILPIFRKRDGGNSHDNNQSTFELIDCILKAGQSFGILPEGVYNPYRRLGPLQKGISRTALKAQENFGITGGVQIVPVGLNWQRPKEHFRDATIVYGSPIAVSEFYPLYVENPAKAYIELQERLSTEMRKLIIHIESQEHYNFIEAYRELFAYEYADYLKMNAANPEEMLTAQQALVKHLDQYVTHHPEEVDDKHSLLNAYRDQLAQKGLRNWLLRRGKITKLELFEDALALILLSPLAAIGALIGAAPLMLAEKMRNKIKDPQFLSSIRYVVAMIARTVIKIILIPIIIWAFRHNIVTMLLSLILLRYVERIMLYYVEFFKKFKGKCRWFRIQRKEKTWVEDIGSQRQRLLSLFDSI